MQVQVQVQVQRSYGVRSSAGCEAQVPASARRGAVARGSRSGPPLHTRTQAGGWKREPRVICCVTYLGPARGAALSSCSQQHKLVGGNVNLA